MLLLGRIYDCCLPYPSVKTDGDTFYLPANSLLEYYKSIAVDFKSAEDEIMLPEPVEGE